MTCGICPADSATTGETCNNLVIRLTPFLSDPAVNSKYGRAWERVLAKAASDHSVQDLSIIRPILGEDHMGSDRPFYPYFEVTAYTESHVKTVYTPQFLCSLWLMLSALSSFVFLVSIGATTYRKGKTCLCLIVSSCPSYREPMLTKRCGRDERVSQHCVHWL